MGVQIYLDGEYNPDNPDNYIVSMSYGPFGDVLDCFGILWNNDPEYAACEHPDGSVNLYMWVLDPQIILDRKNMAIRNSNRKIDFDDLTRRVANVIVIADKAKAAGKQLLWS